MARRGQSSQGRGAQCDPDPRAPRRSLVLTVEYDGALFAGWQRQRRRPSVQAAIEQAILRVTGERVRVRGAGRTDAGVHALAQVAQFETASRLPAERFPAALNAHLPDGVAVLDAREVRPDFHVRYGAAGKIYRYVILNRPARPALDRGRVYHVRAPLDVERMRQAAALLVGRRDFAAFAKEPQRRRSTVRTLRRIEVRRDGERIEIEMEADGFLQHMARRIAGTLIEVGRGRRDPSDVGRPGPTAPAHGLYLVRVLY